MSARSAKFTEALARQPMSATLATRKVLGNKQLNASEAENSHPAVSPVQYDLSPASHADILIPHREVDSEQLVMTDDAQDLRFRMEAELIALRRAQSVFAETHPSVDVSGKLQDLQEMYIGDLLVKDCQISQLRSQLASVQKGPSEDAHLLTVRVQSLQRSLSQERQKRIEAEMKVTEHTTPAPAQPDPQKQVIAKMLASHRLEVHQLKTRLAALQDTNKKLQDRFLPGGSGGVSVATPTATPSVAPSPKGSSGQQVSYVKFSALRAEKRQLEFRMSAEIEQLKLELQIARSDRQSELDKSNEHQRRVISELERKLRESSKFEKEIRDLKTLHNQTLCINDDLENRLLEVQFELENFKRTCSEQHSRREMGDDERADLLLRVEEREDRLGSLQDEITRLRSVHSEEIVNLKSEIETQKNEINEMVKESEDLEELLVRAEKDVVASRERILILENSLAANSAKNLDFDQKKKKTKKSQRVLDEVAQKHVQPAKQVESPKHEPATHRNEITHKEQHIKPPKQVEPQTYRSEITHKNSEQHVVKQVEQSGQQVESPKVSLIGRLEKELASIRESIVLDRSVDRSADEPKFAQLQTAVGTAKFAELQTAPGTALASPVMPVRSGTTTTMIESIFQQAVDLCVSGEFAEAVGLLQEASSGLQRLGHSELCGDSDSLKILESDIYGQLGVAFQSLGQINQAIDAYATAVLVDPEAHACHANLAVLLNHVSKPGEAEKHARIAADLAPESNEYRILLAEIEHTLNPNLHSVSHSVSFSPFATGVIW